MLNPRQPFPALKGVMLIPFILLAACTHQPGPDAGATGSREVKLEEIHGDGVLQVDHPEQFRLATVEKRPAADELHVTGVVTPDVNRAVPVLSLAGGRAVDVRVRLGDQVTKGQVLLVIESPDV